MKPELFWQNLGQSAVYYPKLAQMIGGVGVAVLLQAFIQRQLNSDNQEWLQITRKEIEEVTGLNRFEQERARQELERRSLLQLRFVNGDRDLLEFRLHWDALETLITTQKPPSARVDPLVLSAKADPHFPSRRSPVAVGVNPSYEFKGPWESQEQFEAFQKALLVYAQQQGLNNPSAWVFKIVDSMTKGVISPFWDEFVSGIPLGENQKVQREWEIEPGIPYPAFEEDRIQYYCRQGEPIEAAVAKARGDLRKPTLAKDLWDGFLRKCDRLADEAMKAKRLGVQHPYLPISFSERPSPSKESVIEKLAAVNQTSLAPSDEPLKPPSLKDLQRTYQSPIGRGVITKLIQQNPHWGFAIQDGQIVDLHPF